MFRVECVLTAVWVALIFMPLLTELVSMENGVCYRHGAPNGAVRTRRRAPLNRKQQSIDRREPATCLERNNNSARRAHSGLKQSSH